MLMESGLYICGNNPKMKKAERKIGMTTEERRANIEALIKEKKELDVNFIKDRFGISSVTVRNDLMFLERKGVVKRLFGKAVLRDDRIPGGFDFQHVDNLEVKEKIGKLAATLIEENDSVMFYTGTTTMQVARNLDDKMNLIAVTNSIYIAHELRRFANAKLVLIGGNISMDTGATYGVQAINQLEHYNIDKLFLSVDGIDADGGITNNYPYEADINFALIKMAKKIIVIADHTKIGKTHFIHMGNIDDVDILVTDSKAPADKIEAIRKKGVTVYQV